MEQFMKAKSLQMETLLRHTLELQSLGSMATRLGLVLLLLALTVLLGLRELLKPVDRYPSPRGRKWRLPPGPRGLPLIGNLLLYSQGERAAFEIAKYGEMTTTHLGSKLWVVLNSDRLVNELYAKKGNITNERPPYPIANTLLSRGRRSIVLPVDGWTERRKLMQQLLSGTALVQYQKYQNSESLVLLRRYLEQPSLWYKHNSAYATSVIYRITFGESPDLKDVQEVQRAQKLFLLNVPPFNRWDCFPELATLPRFLQWWRAKYEALGEFTLRAYGGYWNSMRTKIEQGLAAPSFAADVIHGKFQGSDEDRMFLAMQLVGAGSDTTRLSINISILAAVVHPQAFYKARAEIDRVCGAGERLPNFDDEPSLPYVSAFIKELLRWRRIFNWTPEHALSEDLEFEGYHFPKGTCFVINHVVITNTYDEPEKILPERWLDGYERDLLRNNWQFGAGRRVCVGARLAQKSLFINVSRLICCFDFEAREAFDNSDINRFATNEPFPIRAKVRDKKFAELVKNASQDLNKDN